MDLSANSSSREGVEARFPTALARASSAPTMEDCSTWVFATIVGASVADKRGSTVTEVSALSSEVVALHSGAAVSKAGCSDNVPPVTPEALIWLAASCTSSSATAVACSTPVSSTALGPPMPAKLVSSGTSAPGVMFSGAGIIDAGPSTASWTIVLVAVLSSVSTTKVSSEAKEVGFANSAAFTIPEASAAAEIGFVGIIRAIGPSAARVTHSGREAMAAGSPADSPSRTAASALSSKATTRVSSTVIGMR